MEALNFLDFELEITADEEYGYTVAVIHSPAGEARASLDLSLSDLELENYILTLQNALLRSSIQHRRVLTPEAETVQAFGGILFDALFSGDVRSLYAVSLREASQRGVGLRIKLRIEPDELAVLPWEFLYDPKQAEYVALSRNTPIVRYLDLPRPVRPLTVTPPLRILGMAASPSDQASLDVALEQERLRRALQGLEEQGLVTLDWLEGQTWRDLQQALYQNQYHIFHFIGHGYFDEAREEGMVVFANPEGRSRNFSATNLARLLADQMTLRLVVLNSCEGAKAGEYDVFSSTAATLVRRGIPAVIAMQYDITDEAAIQMTETFYQALAGGLSVDAALSEARKAIVFAQPNTLEWGAPVLFMRAADGRIFDIDRTKPVVPSDMIGKVIPPLAPEEVEPAPEVAQPGEEIGAVATPSAEEAAVQEESPEVIQPSAPAEETEMRVSGARGRRRGCLIALGVVLLILALLAFALAAGWWPSAPGGEMREFGDVSFVYVPAGEFGMGSDPDQLAMALELCRRQVPDRCNPESFEDELPLHPVQLDGYWIMQNEVTNAEYARCVEAGACREPGNDRWRERDQQAHPVTQVSWADAVDYAAWLSDVSGRPVRLPTEAEWEKAARNGDQRLFPWGDEWDPARANYCDRNCELDWRDPDGDDGFAETAPVGAYPEGVSPAGALDMGGNVWEWTADWHDQNYYGSSPEANPQGPERGEARVVRGGSWMDDPSAVRTASRHPLLPGSREPDVGFRLVAPDF